MLGDTVNERAVRILLEYNLVSDKFVKAELQPGTVHVSRQYFGISSK